VPLLPDEREPPPEKVPEDLPLEGVLTRLGELGVLRLPPKMPDPDERLGLAGEGAAAGLRSGAGAGLTFGVKSGREPRS
jgi:hypothetical protein